MERSAHLEVLVTANGIKQTGRELDNLASVSKRTETATERMRASYGRLSGALAGVGLTAFAAQAIKTADAYGSMNARLNLVTKSSTEFARTQSALFELANRTRAPLEATFDLYSKITRATESLNTSERDRLRVTEAINKAMVVSGATGQAAEAAITQLAQGFASGTLRGDELNSVLEQTPRLAQAIAKGLGLTIGQLRAYGAEGRLTSEAVFGAILRDAQALDAEFDKMPSTVGQAMQKVGNSLSIAIGKINEATGATQYLVKWLEKVPTAMDKFKDGKFLSGLGFGGVAGYLGRGTGAENEAAALESARLTRKSTAERLASARTSSDFTSKLLNGRSIKELENDLRDAEKAVKEAEQRYYKLTGVAGGRGLLNPDAALPALALPEADAKGKGKKGRAAPAEKISDSERYLDNLKQQLESVRQLSAVEQVLADIQEKRIKGLDAASAGALIDVAEQIDLKKRMNDLFEESQGRIKADEIAFQTATERANQYYDASLTSAEKLAEVLKEIDALYERGAFGAVGSSLAMERQARAIQGAKDQMDELKGSAKDMADTLAQAIINGQDFGQALQTLAMKKFVLEPLAKQIETIITNLGKGASASAGGGGGGLGGLLSTAASFLFGGGRANGGPVSPGTMYEVNERGTPELLNVGGRQFLMMANQAGQVANMTAGGGAPQAGGVTVQINSPVYQIGSNVSRAEVYEGIQAGNAHLEAKIADALRRKGVV